MHSCEVKSHPGVADGRSGGWRLIFIASRDIVHPVFLPQDKDDGLQTLTVTRGCCLIFLYLVPMTLTLARSFCIFCASIDRLSKDLVEAATRAQNQPLIRLINHMVRT